MLAHLPLLSPTGSGSDDPTMTTSSSCFGQTLSRSANMASFRLSAGTRWHASRLRKAQAPPGPATEALPAAQLDASAPPAQLA